MVRRGNTRRIKTARVNIARVRGTQVGRVPIGAAIGRANVRSISSRAFPAAIGKRMGEPIERTLRRLSRQQNIERHTQREKAGSKRHNY